MTKTYNDIEAVTRLLEEVSFFIASGTWLSFILDMCVGAPTWKTLLMYMAGSHYGMREVQT